MHSLDLSGLMAILQTSISPVAVISGVGLLLLSMTNRLGRTTDRARMLCDLVRDPSPQGRENLIQEIRILYNRSRILRLSICFALLSILFISLLIVTLFSISLFGMGMKKLVLVLFALSLLSLLISLILFLEDINLSLKALKLELKGVI